MESPQILQTTDYSIFKFVNFNRDKQKKHIQIVKKTLLIENLLHLHPILVNEEMEVIDGQHRLAAAQELGLEVFYIKGKISYEHILNSNLIQKKMNLSDVIKFYALKDKIEDYVKLRDYLLLLELQPKALLGLIFGSCLPSMVDFIKTGKFKMPNDLSKIEGFINAFVEFRGFVKEKRISPFSMFASHHFTVAYRNMMLLSQFNETVFMNKLQMRWFELKPQMNSKEWTKVLLNIFNWKNHNPIEVNLLNA